jgi:hypothetical protein
VATLTSLTAQITAVGALGVAAFGLVDALKALPGGGISRAGFKFIRATVKTLTPPDSRIDEGGLNQAAVLYTLTSQWINGVATAAQISIAKSQIKLRLTPTTAPGLAAVTGVNANILTRVATKIVNSTGLTSQESDTYGRFDLMLSTLLDQAYQRYRNAAKLTAVPIAVALSMVAAHVLPAGAITEWQAALLGSSRRLSPR